MSQNSQVREMILTRLGESVKEVQLEAAQTGLSKPLGSCDATSSLCVGLEAVFLHGLRESLASRIAQAFSDSAEPPQPSFWSPLLIFSHRDAIQQVGALRQINTDVGRCRAWLRIGLSEGLLSNYFEAMRRQNCALHSYYHRTAFVRDLERLEVAQRLLVGLEPLRLSLATNSSLLNSWPSSTLMLAGLWAPPLRACPVAPAQDVAQTLLDQPLETEEVPKLLQVQTRTLAVSPIDEDEALRIILRQPQNFQGSPPPQESESCLLLGATADEQVPEVTSSIEDEPISSVGNSLAGRAGWSSGSCDADVIPDAQSYDALLESYNLLSGGYVRTPDLRDFLKKFSETNANKDNSIVTTAEDPMSASIYGLGYEVVPKSPSSLSDIPEFRLMLGQLRTLAREAGLDSQNYSCISCSCPIGVTFGRAKLCGLTGNYYCCDCHIGDEWTIPSRVLFNWDFRKFGVSKKAAEFLTEILTQPLLDIAHINPALYSCCQDMAQLQSLRIQLNLLRAYLFTCREPVIAELQKKVWPHEYLFEHVHTYSLADLQQIPSGGLAHKLSRVVEFARNHVLGCWLCSQKGFICEVCNNPQVIYPFDTDSTFRCSGCSAVFHVGCLNAKQPCPKCERRRKREEDELSKHVE